MPKKSTADHNFEWSRLIATVRTNAGDVPYLLDLSSELEMSSAGSETGDGTAGTRCPALPEDAGHSRSQGPRAQLAARLRSGLNTKYGFGSEKLIEFGMSAPPAPSAQMSGRAGGHGQDRGLPILYPDARRNAPRGLLSRGSAHPLQGSSHPSQGGHRPLQGRGRPEGQPAPLKGGDRPLKGGSCPHRAHRALRGRTLPLTGRSWPLKGDAAP